MSQHGNQLQQRGDFCIQLTHFVREHKDKDDNDEYQDFQEKT